jgi:hypothetical protein
MLSGQGDRTDFAATNLKRNNVAEQEHNIESGCAEKILSAAQGIVGRGSWLRAQIDGFVLRLTLSAPSPLAGCPAENAREFSSLCLSDGAQVCWPAVVWHEPVFPE